MLIIFASTSVLVAIPHPATATLADQSSSRDSPSSINAATPTIVANFTFTPTKPNVDVPVYFDASSSHSNMYINSYIWDWGDGSFPTKSILNTLQTPSHTFMLPGIFTVTLTIIDDSGAAASKSRSVTVNMVLGDTPPAALFTFSPSDPVVGQTVTFDASASRDPDSDPIANYQWSGGENSGQTQFKASGATLVSFTHTFSTAGYAYVSLNVTDSHGHSSAQLVTFFVTRIPYRPGVKPGDFGEYYVRTNQTSFDIVGFSQNVTQVPANNVTTSLSVLPPRGPGISILNETYDVRSGLGLIGKFIPLVLAANLTAGDPPFVDLPFPPISSTTTKTLAGAPREVNFLNLTTSSGGKFLLEYDRISGLAVSFDVENQATNGVGQKTVLVLGDTNAWRATGNETPLPLFYPSPLTPSAGQMVYFDGSRSYDPDRDQITSYQWDFGDGSPTVTTTNPTTTHSYSSSGTFNVTLTVTDPLGASASASRSIQVSTSPTNVPPIALFTFTPSNPIAQQPVSFDASASYDPDGQVTGYSWKFGDGSPLVNSTAPTVTHSFVSYGTYHVTLFVTDNGAATSSVIHDVTVASPMFDYSLSNSGPVSIQKGMSGSVTVTTKLTSGGAQSVALSCVTPLPSGISCTSFNPGSVIPSSSGATSTLTISVASSVVPGSYSVKVTGLPLGATTTPTVVDVTVTALGGGTVVATVTVGKGPFGVAYDNSNGYIYVANLNSNTTSIINGTTVVGTVAVGRGPGGVAYDSGNGYVYVANFYSNTVSVINGTTVVATVPVGSSPSGVAYDAGNRYVYVTNFGSGNITVINGTTVVATVPVGFYPQGVAYDSGNGYVYVTNANSTSTFCDNTVSVISGTMVVATLATGSYGFQACPLGVGYDTGNGYVYVADAFYPYIIVINGTTVVATVTAPTGPLGVGVGYDSGNGYIYVTSPRSNSTIVISGTTVVATVPVGSSPSGVAYDAGNRYVYVANGGSNTVSVISTAASVSFDYSLSNSGPLTIQSGSSGHATINATLISGTAQSVTLSCVTPLPMSITCASFNPASVSPSSTGATSTLTISVASSVAVGSYIVEVTGSPLGATTTPTTVTVTVTQPTTFDFSLSMPSPNSLTVVQGSTSPSSSITTHLLTGSPVPVTFSVSGLPTGVTVAFTNNPCSPTCSVYVSFSAAATATLGTTTITINSSGGAASHSTSLSLTVSAPAAFGFSLGAPSPGTLTVVQGSASPTSSITATLASGTTTPVTFSASGLPSGVTATFTNNPCSPTCPVTVSFSASAGAVIGASTVTITASGGGASHSTSLSLSVVAKATTAVSVSCSPSAVNVGRFTTCSATVTGSSPSGDVTFTTSSSTGAFTPSTSTCTLSAGACSITYADASSSSIIATITASYRGDSKNSPNSGSFSLSVSKPTGTIAVGTSSTTISNGGASVSQAATSISVTITGSSATNGTPVGVTTQTLSAPNTGIPSPTALASPSYYDVLVTGVTTGNAQVCISFTSASVSTTMQYWSGTAWTSASNITVNGTTVCGTIPVAALTGTNIALGNPVQQASSPADYTLVYIGAGAAAVIILVGVFLAPRRRRGPTRVTT